MYHASGQNWHQAPHLDLASSADTVHDVGPIPDAHWRDVESSLIFLNNRFSVGKDSGDTVLEPESTSSYNHSQSTAMEGSSGLTIAGLKNDICLLAGHFICAMRQAIESTKNSTKHLAADTVRINESVSDLRAEVNVVKVDMQHLAQDRTDSLQLSKQLADVARTFQEASGVGDDAGEFSSQNAALVDLRNDVFKIRKDLESLKKIVCHEGPEGALQSIQSCHENQAPLIPEILSHFQEKVFSRMESADKQLHSELDERFHAMNSTLRSELDAREGALNSRIQAAKSSCFMLVERVDNIEEVLMVRKRSTTSSMPTGLNKSVRPNSPINPKDIPNWHSSPPSSVSIVQDQQLTSMWPSELDSLLTSMTCIPEAQMARRKRTNSSTPKANVGHETLITRKSFEQSMCKSERRLDEAELASSNARASSLQSRHKEVGVRTEAYQAARTDRPLLTSELNASLRNLMGTINFAFGDELNDEEAIKSQDPVINQQLLDVNNQDHLSLMLPQKVFSPPSRRVISPCRSMNGALSVPSPSTVNTTVCKHVTRCSLR